MDTTDIGMYILISINLLAFLIYLITLKFGLKKRVSFKMVAYFVIAFMIGFLIIILLWDMAVFSPQAIVEIDYAVLIGELIGYGLAFLVFDAIIWYIAKWLYKQTQKKPQVESQNVGSNNIESQQQNVNKKPKVRTGFFSPPHIL